MPELHCALYVLFVLRQKRVLLESVFLPVIVELRKCGLRILVVEIRQTSLINLRQDAVCLLRRKLFSWLKAHRIDEFGYLYRQVI